MKKLMAILKNIPLTLHLRFPERLQHIALLKKSLIKCCDVYKHVHMEWEILTMFHKVIRGS